MSGNDLNIVVLPDEQISSHAIELSEILTSQIPSEFTLNTTNFKPHITLYQGSFPEKNIPIVIETVKEIAKNTNPLSLSMTEFFVSSGRFVWWNTTKDGILELHENVLDKVNPLREGLIPAPSLEQLPDLTGQIRQNVLETGSLYVRGMYPPHITLTRIKNDHDREKTLQILKENDSSFSFKVRSIGIAQLGAHGTISEILKEFIFEK